MFMLQSKKAKKAPQSTYTASNNPHSPWLHMSNDILILSGPPDYVKYSNAPHTPWLCQVMLNTLPDYVK